jgi:putative phosphoesterase
MKIGVLADTHIPDFRKEMPKDITSAFKNVHIIIHAGDITDASVLLELEKMAPVIAVQGNRDCDALKTRLPKKIILSLMGHRIGIVHGDGEKGTTMQRITGLFADLPVECVIFGHSHIPCNLVIDDVLYFNPGSPTSRRRQAYPSVGILDIGESIAARHIFFDGS